MKVRVDRMKCKGYELCAGEAPEVFDVDESGKAFVRNGFAERVPTELSGPVREAQLLCPERAILVVDTDD